MSKYDVRFCNCGRIHFIEWKSIDEAINKQKQILLVCNSCGNSFAIGADERYWEYEKGWDMYSYGIDSQEIEDLSKFHRAIFSYGDRVIMMTGKEATSNFSDFVDFETKKPEDKTDEEWDKLRRTINVQYTKNWLKDDEKWESLKGYYGFHGVEVE